MEVSVEVKVKGLKWLEESIEVQALRGDEVKVLKRAGVSSN